MARRRAPSPPPEEPVSWRGGTHINQTPIWCDARRRREVCFASSAHAVSGSRHGQLIATAPTLALLARNQRPLSQLSVPYGRPFTLGTRRLELMRSGHALGGASLIVDVDGERVLYAGAVKLHGCGYGGEADLRPCDTLVLAADYGLPHFRFPDASLARQQVIDFCLEVGSDGGLPVLLVSSPSKGLDLAAGLAEIDLPLAAHRSIYNAARRLRPLGHPIPSIRRWSGPRQLERRPVLLWPTARRDDLRRLALPDASRICLVSGAALDRGVMAQLHVDLGIGWSNSADHDELLRYIDASEARRVYLTSRYAEPLASSLNGGERTVKVLAPPRQLSLFL